MESWLLSKRLWTSGMDYFYNIIDGDIQKPELFTSTHIDIRKKKIIEGLTVEFNDHLKYNKDHEIICYSLVKVDFSKYRNNHNHNKWGIKHEENIMDNIKTNIYKKKLELKNMNFKLNANEDLLILPGFWVTSQNADGYFNDSNK